MVDGAEVLYRSGLIETEKGGEIDVTPLMRTTRIYVIESLKATVDRFYRSTAIVT